MPNCIVLVGVRGCGKSSLGLMASSMLEYVYVDAERCVSECLHMTDSEYLQSHTTEEYQELEYRLIVSAVEEQIAKKQNMVVVLPAIAIENQPLLDYFVWQIATPYLIHIVREEAKVLEYLEYSEPFEKGKELLRKMLPRYSAVANYVYFNMHSDPSFIENKYIIIRDRQTKFPTLALKAAELDFVSYLEFLTGIERRVHTNLSFRNKYTTAIQVNFPNLHIQDILYNASDVVAGCDAVDLQIDAIALMESGSLNDIEDQISRLVANIRRGAELPIIFNLQNSLTDIYQFMQTRHQAKSDEKFDIMDFHVFYLNFLGIATRLGLAYVALDLSLCCNGVKYSSEGTRDDIMVTNDTTNEMVTLVKDFLRKCGKTIVMGIYHSLDPKIWDSNYGGVKIMEFAHELGITMMRITSKALDLTDNLKCWNFIKYMMTEYPDILLTAFNTGELGKLSKILNRVLTPVHIDLNKDLNIPIESNDWIVNSDVQRSLFRAFIVPGSSFHVTGANSSNNLMPAVHQQTYSELGLPHSFSSYESTSISGLAALIKSPNFGGASILPPFTREALHFADSTSTHARAIGFVNTLVTERHWTNPTKLVRIKGYNTDWIVVSQILRSSLSPVNTAIREKTALIIGSCGVSRASIYALIRLNYKNVLVYDTKYTTAKTIADEFNNLQETTNGNSFKTTNVIALTKKSFNQVELAEGCAYPVVIIEGKCTADPKTGKPPLAIEIPSGWFKNETGGVAMQTSIDLLISPMLDTAFELQDKGWIGACGLNYLYCQSCAQFELFVNKPAPRHLMKKFLLDVYQKSTRSL
ncbi:hypothetical protein CAAN3_01S14972 [[Candida] anglica]